MVFCVRRRAIHKSMQEKGKMCVCARGNVNGVLCAQTSHPLVDAGEGEDVCVCQG